MTAPNKYVLGGIAIALVAVFVLASQWYTPTPAPAPTPAPTPAGASAQLIRDYSPELGPANAPVTIVEFLDPECEACAAMHPIIKEVMREFDGRLRLVIRYMPLHGNSAYAAGLLEGARAHDKYWPLMDEFFLKQPQWASHQAPRPDLLIGYATALGLDGPSLEAGSRSAETIRRIEQDQADGRAFGVRGTPTLFINGRMLMQLGHQPLRLAVLEALASAR